jgi:hydroxymethylpyrimidine/phosphomethylpyrimidine kinase
MTVESLTEDGEPAFPPIVLAFSAADPSGGTGIQADVLTLASMGCHPLSVVTALTVQDTLGVEGVLPVESEWVADQARCLLEDMKVDAFLIGALGSVENIAAIAEIISDYPEVPLIVDAVLAGAGGQELASEEMVHATTELVLPQTTILVANSLDLRRLVEADEDDERTLAVCAAAIVEAGCEYVLATGTHEPSREIVNILYGKTGTVRTDRWPRLPGTFHGAGSTLAAAVAAMLANGLDMADAVREGQEYVWQSLKRAYRPGMGKFLPDRLFWAREESEARGDAPESPRADARGTH